MYLAYVDDSGDPGERGSFSFALGCVLVEADAWPQVLDGMLDFRRLLRDRHRIPMRLELKANWVIRGSGPLNALHLSPEHRRRIYRDHLRIQPKLGTESFAVVISKRRHYAQPTPGPVERRAWEYLLQRLERFSDERKASIILIHDEGNNDMVSALARKWRRAGSAGMRYGAGRLDRPFTRLVDDAIPRNSNENYMLQLADFAAYAAFRKVFPPMGPALNDPERVATPDAWDLIDSARYLRATRDRQDGIVAWI